MLKILSKDIYIAILSKISAFFEKNFKNKYRINEVKKNSE